MKISTFHPGDIEAIANVWNAFWRGVPRAFSVTADDLAARLVDCPVFAETQLLTLRRDGKVEGFIHFGPRDDWWFTLENRPPTSPETGTIYALCASNEEDYAALLESAEAELKARGATVINLWPTWAQGAVPFYNGLTPSNEVSGLWRNHQGREWAERRGYTILSTYKLGVLPLPILSPGSTEGSRAAWTDFQSPIMPNAKRLSLQSAETGEEIGWVVAADSSERNAATGSREWAAFDVAIRESWRGQGWGRVLMQHAAYLTSKQGATSLQLHVVEGNFAAEALYFRSMGFDQVPDGTFITLQKELGHETDD